jgi:hypothetical protein
MSSLNPKFTKIYPSSIRSTSTFDSIPENDLNRQALFNEENKEDEVPFLNLQELGQSQPQQSFTEETAENFFESPNILNQEEFTNFENPLLSTLSEVEQEKPIQESNQEVTVSPVKQKINQIEKNYQKTQKANEANRKRFAKMREENKDKYDKKDREAELTKEIQELKPKIERLNKIHINDLTAQQIQQLREMRPIYARLQAEKRHGTIENAIKNINTLEDDIKNNNVDNSGDDYISTQDKKLLNNLRLINGYPAYSAKRVTFNEAMEEIKQLRKALRLLQSSSSSERNRPFGANISTIRGMKKDDEEVLNVRDRSTKK